MQPQLILADDNDDFRALLGEVLTQASYEVLQAANGSEALRHCETRRVAAAVVDLVMPGKEGLETILEMRKRFPQIKILAISGGGRGSADTYLQMALTIGADAALAKPFGGTDLLAALRCLLPAAPPLPS
jgi:DNA-binding response OmpR family regulator